MINIVEMVVGERESQYTVAYSLLPCKNRKDSIQSGNQENSVNDLKLNYICVVTQRIVICRADLIAGDRWDADSLHTEIC